jgi:hypothetical protein
MIEEVTRIWVGDPGEPSISNASRALVIGTDIRINAENIAKYCGADTPAVADDLAVICAAIVYADRKTTRRRSDGWGRTIQLHIPVVRLEVFNAGSLRPELEELLRFLTGDHWLLEFRRRVRTPEFQQPLPLGNHYDVSIPFSGGLDSFAAYRLACLQYGADRVLKVTTSRKTQADVVDAVPLYVPFDTADKKREGSYRSRVFPYFVFAGLGASAAACNRVLIPENGQGSLGPALTPFRDEWPFRSCHPAFVGRLSRWLSTLLGRQIAFDQPYAYRTKASVLAELRTKGLSDGWEKTRSCSADPRQGYGPAGCGFCGGCVLRRASLLCAGLSSDRDRYAFDDLRQPAAEIFSSGGRRPFKELERQIGGYAIRSMSEFAALEVTDTGCRRVDLEAAQIKDACGADVSDKIRALRRAHEQEWSSVLETLPSNSWFKQVAEGMA